MKEMAGTLRRHRELLWKSSFSKYARIVRRLYFISSRILAVCYFVRFSGRFKRHQRLCFNIGS